MSHVLMYSILSPAPTRITHLELRNLQQWSELDPPLPTFTTSQDLLNYWRTHRSKHQIIPDTQLMKRSFDSVLGLTTRLTSLCITTVASGDHWTDVGNWQEQCYASWARFIHSVRTITALPHVEARRQSQRKRSCAR